MKVKHVVKGFLLAAIFISLSVTSFSVQAKNGLVKHKTNYAAPAVAGWYFRAVSGYPAAISFEPVVLFKNGEYFDELIFGFRKHQLSKGQN